MRAPLLRAPQVPLSASACDFAVQAEPRGTADAVARGRGLDRGRAVPRHQRRQLLSGRALTALRRSRLPGLVAFSREGLLADGQIAPERILRVRPARSSTASACGASSRSPTRWTRRASSRGYYVSMNCWRFDARDLRRLPARAAVAARRTGAAAGGAARDRRRAVSGEAVLSDEGVLDLSGRADIAAVARSACRCRRPVVIADVRRELSPTAQLVATRAGTRRRRPGPAGRARQPARLFVPGTHRGARQAHRLRRRPQPALRRRARLLGRLRAARR